MAYFPGNLKGHWIWYTSESWEGYSLIFSDGADGAEACKRITSLSFEHRQI